VASASPPTAAAPSEVELLLVLVEERALRLAVGDVGRTRAVDHGGEHRHGLMLSVNHIRRPPLTS
jgi:hypothetical protein